MSYIRHGYQNAGTVNKPAPESAAVNRLTGVLVNEALGFVPYIQVREELVPTSGECRWYSASLPSEQGWRAGSVQPGTVRKASTA